MLGELSDVTDRYVIKEQVGVGGMGVVYRAYDRERNSDVALKTFRNPKASELYRLKKEFRALSELKHPNVVELYELTVDETGQCYYTMELVDGVDPRRFCGVDVSAAASRDASKGLADDTLSGDGGIEALPDFARVRDVMRQLCTAVAAVHDAGKLHRDIKCSNLLVTPSGVVKLLDFGLVMDQFDIRGDSFAGKTVGTLAYMSPEQAGGRTDLTVATDWYATGVVLFELLTGALPFDGAALRVLVAKQQHEAPRPSSLVPSVPQDLDDVCFGLLETVPEKRLRGHEALRMLGAEVPSMVSRHLSLSARTAEGVRRFVGREAELASLRADYDRVLAGQCTVRRISGPTGHGKSALVQYHLQELRENDPDVQVIQGRCREQERVTYRAMDSVVDSLSGLWARLPESDAYALLPRFTNALLGLFPVLGRVACVVDTPHLPAPTDPKERRARAYAALREIFNRLTNDRPAVLVIDDFQWADEESCLLLSELLRPPDSPILHLILVSREETTGADEPRRGDAYRHVASLGRQTVLGPLTSEETRELCQLVSETVSTEDAEEIARESKGVPLFATELARFAATSGPASRPKLNEVITARLDMLPHGARALTELIALSVAPTSLDLLVVALREEDSEIRRLASLLRTTGFVRTSGSGRNATLEIYHQQVEAVVLDAIDESRRRTLHGRLANAHRVLMGVQPHAMGHHFEQAGEMKLAVDAYLIASRLAEERGDFLAAAELASAAERLAPEDDRADLTWRSAKCLAMAGNEQRAAELGATLLYEGEDSARASRVATWFGRAGDVRRMKLYGRPAMRRLRVWPRGGTASSTASFLAQLPVVTWAVLAKRRSDVAAVDRDDFDLMQAFAWAHSRHDLPNAFYLTALNICRLRSRGTSEQWAETLVPLANVLATVWRRGYELVARRLREFEGERVRYMAILVEGMAEFLSGRWQKAEQPLMETAGLSVELDDVARFTRSAAVYTVWNSYYSGRLRRLVLAQQEVLSGALRDREVQEASRARLGLATAAYLVVGDPALAEREVAAARQAVGELSPLDTYYEWLSEVMLALYRGTPVEDLIVRARKDGYGYRNYVVEHVFAEYLLLRLALASKSGELDRLPSRFARARLRRSSRLWVRGVARYYDGLAQLQAGRVDAADRTWRASLELLSRSGTGFYHRAVSLRMAQLNGDQAGIDATFEWAATEGVGDWLRLARVAAPGMPGELESRGASDACEAKLLDIRRASRSRSAAGGGHLSVS